MVILFTLKIEIVAVKIYTLHVRYTIQNLVYKITETVNHLAYTSAKN